MRLFKYDQRGVKVSHLSLIVGVILKLFEGREVRAPSVLRRNLIAERATAADLTAASIAGHGQFKTRRGL